MICWVLTDSCWPHTIKSASESWHSLWKYPREEAIDRAIGMLQNKANEVASAMLMRRFYHKEKTGTLCTNSNKFGQFYTHVVCIVEHPFGLVAISTDISPQGNPLKKHEKFEYAHRPLPHVTDLTISAVFKEVLRHVSVSTLSHEQRFMRHIAAMCNSKSKTRPPKLSEKKRVL